MLFKSLKFYETNAEERTFEGYAAAYGNVDSDGDIIVRGAFAKSIKEGLPANRIKILYQHDWNTPIGVPIEMREEQKGLYVRGKVSKTRTGDEALELMRDGVLDRMSVGFSIPAGKAETDEKGIRHIYEGILREFSIVTFPANEQAVITGVKALKDIRVFAQDAELSEKAKQELLDEISSITALIKGEQPGNPTARNKQPPLSNDEVKRLIDSTLGIFALDL